MSSIFYSFVYIKKIQTFDFNSHRWYSFFTYIFLFLISCFQVFIRSNGYVFFTYVFLFLSSCLQVFNSIRWYVFFTCVFSLFQGYLVNGVINAIISTLEKRFELPSSKSGLIVSSNDFIAFFLVLFISFYGGERHKPRLIGLGIITLGIGSFIFSLPHFFTGLYSVSGGNHSVSLTKYKSLQLYYSQLIWETFRKSNRTRNLLIRSVVISSLSSK